MNQSRFEIFRDADGEFRFRLKAANGEVLMQSEAYTNETDARRGVVDLIANVRESKGETVFVIGSKPADLDTK